MKEVFSMINKVGMEGRDKSALMRSGPPGTGPKSQYWQQSIPTNKKKQYKDTISISSSEECITVPVVRSVLYKNSTGDDVKSTTTEWVTVSKKNSGQSLPSEEHYMQNVNKPFMTRSESSPVISRHNLNRNPVPSANTSNVVHVPIRYEYQTQLSDQNLNKTNSEDSESKLSHQSDNSSMKQTTSNNSIKSILKKTSSNTVEKTTVNNVVISTVPQSRIVPRIDNTEDKQLVTARILSQYDSNIRHVPERTIVSPRTKMTRSVSDNNNFMFSPRPPVDYNECINTETIKKLLHKPPPLPKQQVQRNVPTSSNTVQNTPPRNPAKEPQYSPDYGRTSRPTTKRDVYKQSSPSKSPGRSDSIFSPTYTKVLSEREMSAREAWAETQRRKAKMREEFFKLPYEEVNWEIVNGRRSRSEPRVKTYSLKSTVPPVTSSNLHDMYKDFKNRDVSPEISRNSVINRSLPPSQRINRNDALSTTTQTTTTTNYNENIQQTRGRRMQKFSPIKEVSDKTKSGISPKHQNLNFVNRNNNVNNITNRNFMTNGSYNNNNNTTSNIVPPNINMRENVNGTKRTVQNMNEKYNSVDISMRNGPSYSNHHLELKSISNPNGGTVTVRRYKVPQIPFQEKWEWIKKYAPEALGPLQNDYESNRLNDNEDPTWKTSPINPPISPKSPTSPVLLTTPSPTPSLAGSSCCMSSASSSSSSGCYSGSCSPTPPPSRMVKAVVPPTHL